jgi:hypothetical protein
MADADTPIDAEGNTTIGDFINWFIATNSDDRHDLIYVLQRLHWGLITAGKSGFYETDEWRSLRYEVLKKYDGRCQCCGERPSAGNPLHVDHIKPRSKYPELSFIESNLGKSNTDQTDWRS